MQPILHWFVIIDDINDDSDEQLNEALIDIS